MHTCVLLPAHLPSHTFSCVNLTPAQPEVEHGEHHTACDGQRYQETSNASHQNLLRKQSYHQRPDELKDRRAVLFPTDESWGLVQPWASPLHYKVILSHEALLQENGNQTHGFFLGAHKEAFENCCFLLLNHTEMSPWLRKALSHDLQVIGRMFSSRINTSFPRSYCPERHPQWSLCQNTA